MPIRVHNLNVEKGDHISSFHDDDRGILNSPKALEKIKRIWNSSVAEVDLYALDLNISPQAALDFAINGTVWGDEDEKYANIDALQDYNVTFDPNAISVILTNNDGGQRYPMTGWMIAHRLFHCFQQDRVSDYHQANLARKGGNPYAIVNKVYTQLQAIQGDLDNYYVSNDFYSDYLPKVDRAALMGSTKACREFRLSNSSELLPESFAQYMLRGKVTLRPLPEGRFKARDTYYKPLPETDMEFCNEVVSSFERFLNQHYALLIEAAKGRVVAL